MTDIVTSTTDVGQLIPWSTPAIPDFMPRASIEFSGTEIIPSKLAADKSRWDLILTLPGKWLWRLLEFRVTATSIQGPGGLDDFAPGMTVDLSADIGGVSAIWNRRFYLWNQTARFADTGFGDRSIRILTTGQDNGAEFTPIDVPNYMINSEGGARALLRWVDMTADATVAVHATWQARFLQYTRTQFNEFPMHSPVPTIAP